MEQIINLIKNNPAVCFILFCVAMFLLVAGVFLGKAIQKIKDRNAFDKVRADAVKRSRAVLGGQFGEQLAPFLPGFPCNPGDVRFVGKPIDYIAFPGSAQGTPIQEILLIEIKSGDSQLSAREREIKHAVENGKVRYVEYRIP